MLILNLGSGKIESKDATIKIDGDVTIFVDRSYDMGYCSTIRDVEEKVISLANGCYPTSNLFISEDVFLFMDHFKFKFDKIIANRIFEHMEYCGGEIGRLLEACNVLSTKNATLEMVVPNAKHLSTMLLTLEQDLDDQLPGGEEPFDSKNTFLATSLEFDNKILILNSEFCNIRIDPHGSIWTPKLAKKYIETEGTWFVHSIEENYKHMGRNIYMKIVCTKKEKVR